MRPGQFQAGIEAAQGREQRDNDDRRYTYYGDQREPTYTPGRYGYGR